MGMPSMSILLHEIAKLLEYAGVEDVTYIRIGTSGGVGVKAGTIILTSESLNYELRPVYKAPVLGKIIERPAVLDRKTTSELEAICKSLELPYVVGKTLSCDDFYEGMYVE
jgi:uridine phosphorylase